MSVVFATTETMKQRLRIKVRGIVQGVGFRPHVYACAQRAKVVGFVGNESSGVFIEVEGSPKALHAFQRELVELAPPLSYIEEVVVEEIATLADENFIIVESASEFAASTLISPDICVCEDCLRDTFETTNRRYLYPFTNCTNCGPRFTIIKDLPYDRKFTTMANFAMCNECQKEYDDPTNRRFHAQPNACPVCGPRVEFVQIDKAETAFHQEAIRAAQNAFICGDIVAVKGIGGFHLACDAANDKALIKLRERKGRVEKPFALMTVSIDSASRFVEINEDERKLLLSKQRPIVLLKKKAQAELSELIAPGNEFLGVMLPYSPLHYLLLTATDAAQKIPQALVMTSGNYANEPIAKDNDEALAKLAPLADAFLLHNREIHAPCDDSVIRVFAGKESPIRRSRGYAPFPVKLPFALQPTLAVGGELKATFCLVKDEHAFLSQHLGDMGNLETLAAMEHSIQHFNSLFRVEPEIVVGDKHPRYLSSQWAKANLQIISSRPAIWREVQHHHAHIAAVMAENGLRGERPVIGFSFDGTGYGNDGAIWGGELLLANYQSFKRAAHLKYIPLPGGDASVKRPYRIALAHLWAAGVDWQEALPPVQACSPTERKILLHQLQTSLNTVATSSMGRLFDAAAALAGVRQTVSYEAQAAIEFEALAAKDETSSYAFELLFDEPTPIDAAAETLQIDAAPVIGALVKDIVSGVAVATISARFHNAVAEMILRLSLLMREKAGLNEVALSGGVFQNLTLLEKTVQRLRGAEFDVFTHALVPANDGGLALGQALIANFFD
jgi:hydrogenase maturation protein HypF